MTNALWVAAFSPEFVDLPEVDAYLLYNIQDCVLTFRLVLSSIVAHDFLEGSWITDQ